MRAWIVSYLAAALLTAGGVLMSVGAAWVWQQWFGWDMTRSVFTALVLYIIWRDAMTFHEGMMRDDSANRE